MDLLLLNEDAMLQINAKMEVLTMKEVMHFYVGKQDLEDCDDAPFIDSSMVAPKVSDGDMKGSLC